jgi:hypothetical protein
MAAMGAVRLVGSPAVIEAANNLYAALLMDAEVTHQKLVESTKHLVDNRQVELTNEELDFIDEQMDNMKWSPFKHLANARAAFEEAARRDLGQGPSGKFRATQGAT